MLVPLSRLIGKDNEIFLQATKGITRKSAKNQYHITPAQKILRNVKQHVFRYGVLALSLLSGLFFQNAGASPASFVQDTANITVLGTKIDLKGQPDYVVHFIESLQPVAVVEMNKYHIPASVILAQAILESGYGMSPLAQNACNFFGIKANRWDKETYLHNGEVFRSYNNLFAAFDDHSKFLLEKPVFQDLVRRNNCNYASWLYGLEATGYAEDPSYIVKLRDIIERYALYRIDEIFPQSDAQGFNTL